MSTDDRINELALKWEEAKEQGRPVTPEELCRDCPELVDKLERRIQILEKFAPVRELRDRRDQPFPVVSTPMEAPPDGAGARPCAKLLVPPKPAANFPPPPIPLGKMPGSLHCPACARAVPEGSCFCPGCGAKLSLRVPEPTGPYQPGPEKPPSPGPPPFIARSPDQPCFVPGTLIAGRYRIVSPLGKGGMGEVYRADDLTLGQPVALKFLPKYRAADPDWLRRFRKEVATARRVSHSNCCRVYDLDEHEGQPFLTMEYVDGEDLASLLRRVGHLPEQRATQIARELCAALAAVHEQGLLHRDLKPANVMLDGRGKVRLADFGLAAAAEDLPATEAGAGTPAYMAPEQLRGESVGVPSDLFALGLVLYELFTGKKAFPADNRVELLKRYDSGPPSRPSSIVPGLGTAAERVILRCLQNVPSDRPRSAYEVLAALPGAGRPQAALAAGETPSPRLVAEAGGEGGLVPAAAGACLAAVVIGLTLCVLVFQRATLIAQVPLPLSPDALCHEARKILGQLGHVPSRHSAFGFDHDSNYLGWVEKNDKSSTRWEVLGSNRPAVLYFWYRQGPAPLIPALLYSPSPTTVEVGRATWHDPPPVHPGMASVKLDLEGRLIEYQAILPDKAEPVKANAPNLLPNWDPLFQAAGLDRTNFIREEPPNLTFTPPVFADYSETWTGSLPDKPDVRIRIEAAAHQGQPVFFLAAWPWTRRNDPDAPVGADAQVGTGQTARAVLFVLLLGVAAVLAPWNLRRGRADPEGAFRLAFFVFAVFLLVWLFETRHVVGVAELRLLVGGGTCALYWAGLCWLSYVALEPFARRLWPETLISWSRLLAGRVRDPRVGRDILIGVLAGTGWYALFALARLAPGWTGQPPPVPYWDWWIPRTFVSGSWVGNFLLNFPYTIRSGLFFWLLFLVLFRAIFRKPWLAVALFVVAFTVLTGPLDGLPPVSWLFVAAAQAMGVAILVRCGVLAFITMAFVAYTLNFPITLDLSAWYARDGLLALGFVLALAGYGFWTSLGGRPLLKGSLFTE